MSEDKEIFVEGATGTITVRLLLKWGKDLPTTPGWYWLKNNDRVGPTDIEICFFDGTCANLINGEVWYLRDFADSEWCGPLISPV